MDPSPDRIIDWAEAPARIAALVRGVRENRPVVVVGITGPVGAGKSSLARALSPCVIRTDDYLPEYASTPMEQRDLPESSDLALLAGHLSDLRAGRDVHVPVWSFKTHRRQSERLVHPAPVAVCEGLHALHATVCGQIDVGVYVDAPPEVRRRRWEALERDGARGWGIERARAYFEQVAEPTFAAMAESYRRDSDLIVRNDRDRPAI